MIVKSIKIAAGRLLFFYAHVHKRIPGLLYVFSVSDRLSLKHLGLKIINSVV